MANPLAPTSLATSSANAVQYEGNSGTAPHTLTVIRSGNATTTARVNWDISGFDANGTLLADYAGDVLPYGTLTFVFGQTTQTVALSISGTDLETLNTAFPLSSSATTVVNLKTGITSNAAADVLLSIAPTNSSQAEGPVGGTTPFTFTVTRSGNTATAFNVGWVVVGSGANSTSPADFLGGLQPTGTVAFVAGQTTQTITVNVTGDTIAEPTESFMVWLLPPATGVTVLNGAAFGTILDTPSAPPALPTLSIAAANAVQAEGAVGGATPFTFTVTRSGDVSGASSATWSVTGSGASPASAADFAGGVLPTGTVGFAAGQTTQTVTVNVTGDNLAEPTEGFAVTLSAPSGATIATATASGSILDTPVVPATLSIAAANASQSEGAVGATTPFTFTVTRSGNTAIAAGANWSVTGSGASPASAADFVGGVLPSGTVSFAAGQTTQTVTVNVTGDNLAEPTEGFDVTLSSPSANTTIATATASGAILDTPVMPASLSIATANASQSEGAVGATTPFTFTVTRAGNTAIAAGANWSVTGSGASPASAADFVGGVPPSGTVGFAAGQTSQVITVNVTGDNLVEPTEGFDVTLSSPAANTTIATATASGAILDTPVVPASLSIAAANASQSEGAVGATTPFTFTVTRAGNTAIAASANWAVTGSGASPASAADFTGGALPSGSVAFAAGQTTQTVTVNVLGDSIEESTEGFAVTLSSPSANTTIATATANGTILDNGVTAATGLHINLKYDASVANAPAGFTTAMQQAASMLQAAISDNITINISVGWGTIGGATISQSGVAEGGPANGLSVPYATLVSTLKAHATSATDTTADASLPASLNPNGNGTIAVWNAQAKALGLLSANATGLDGEIGFSTDFPSYLWVGAGLHELTHAMGRTSGYATYGIEDLMRYTAPGQHVYAGGNAAYFSIDGGNTRVANFDTTSDYGDYASDSLTVGDPFNAYISSGSNSLVPGDLTVMDAIGFTLATPTAATTLAGSGGMSFISAAPAPGVSNVVSAVIPGVTDISDVSIPPAQFMDDGTMGASVYDTSSAGDRITAAGAMGNWQAPDTLFPVIPGQVM